MPLSLHDLSPLRVIIGAEDVTSYLGDSWNFSSADPGGFEACSLQFPRDMASTIRGLPIRIDSGLKVAWEGRVAQVQRSLGHNTTVMGQGYGALLADQSGSMVFVDRDYGRWQGPSVQRQINLAATWSIAGPQTQADPTSGNPALTASFTGPWDAAPSLPLVEGWYDAGPQNLIGSIHYGFSKGANVGTGGNWTWVVYVSSDDVGTINDNTGQLSASASGTGTLSATGSRRFAMVQFDFGVAGGGSNTQYAMFWNPLAVYGNHGLTGRGANPVGFYPSDIFGWVVGQVPGLQAGVIQQTDASNFILPHSVYYTPVTLDSIGGDMATAQGWHWGVWESLSPLTGDPRPRADFRPRPAPGAFTAFCRRSDCDTLDIREDLSQQFNQAVVTWTNVDGTQGAVTVTVDNPILDAAGIPSRTVIFQGGTMTPATAAVFGAEALALTNAQARVAGTADIISPIDGGVRPGWDLRAGLDRLRVADVPSTSAWGTESDFPITRVETSISSSGFTTSVELGSGANLIETLQARLASATALAGNGG